MNVVEYYAALNKINANRPLKISEALHLYNLIAGSPFATDCIRKHARKMRRQIISQSLRRFEREQAVKPHEV